MNKLAKKCHGTKCGCSMAATTSAASNITVVDESQKSKKTNPAESVNSFRSGDNNQIISNENSLILQISSDTGQKTTNTLPKLSLYLPFSLIIFQLTFTLVHSDKCFVFGPGMTIHGGDYRRDYGVKRQVCAETCKYDVCCMGFEFQEREGICTLKSRSLNGSVTAASDDTYFGLCVDFTDPERNRFWDHEMHGPAFAVFEEISRFKCAQMCQEKLKSETSLLDKTKKLRFARSSAVPKKSSPPITYSWKNSNPLDSDFEIGTCSCIKVFLLYNKLIFFQVLQTIRLSFGSFAGFLPST